MALRAREIGSSRQSLAAAVLHMAGAAGGEKRLLLVMGGTVMAGEAGLILHGRAIARTAHMARSTLLAKDGMGRRERSAAVDLLVPKRALPDHPAYGQDREHNRQQQPPAPERGSLGEILQVNALGQTLGSANAGHGSISQGVNRMQGS